MKYNRRSFISFLGKASLGAIVVPPFLMSSGNSHTPTTLEKISKATLERLKKVVLKSIHPSDKDDLVLAKGLHYHPIIKWGDPINKSDTFGFNNDFTCFIPLDDENPKDGLLWVNHEYMNPLFVSEYNYRNKNQKRTKQQVDKEMYQVGGSIVRIKEENGTWNVVENDPLNRRITAKTPMKINWDRPH
jgi:secreted PhoX family phosphatase